MNPTSNGSYPHRNYVYRSNSSTLTPGTASSNRSSVSRIPLNFISTPHSPSILGKQKAIATTTEALPSSSSTDKAQNAFKRFKAPQTAPAESIDNCIERTTFQSFRGRTILNLASYPYLKSAKIIDCQLQDLNLNGNTELEEIVATRSQISGLDLGSNPSVSLVDISNNLIRNLNLASNTKLRILDASSNQLCEIDLSANIELERINLRKNSLLSLNGLNRLTQLKQLDLSSNRLRSLPLIGQAIEKIDISQNRIANLSSLDSLTQLTIFNASHNGISELPSIDSLVMLKTLNLSNNRINTLPDFRQNGRLELVDLRYNRLQTLPDSLASLPRNCRILLYGNFLTRAGIHRFLCIRQTQRALNPNCGPSIHFSLTNSLIPLEQDTPPAEELISWNLEMLAMPAVYQSKLPHLPANNYAQLLTQENSDTLAKFLTKIRQTKDYRNSRSINDVILFVNHMLRLACENELFKDQMFLLMAAALGNCADAIQDGINKIKPLMLIYQSQFQSDQELADIIIGIERLRLIETFAGENPNGDPIERNLALQLSLKQEFNLPISMKAMIFPRCSEIRRKRSSRGGDLDEFDPLDPTVIRARNRLLTQTSSHAHKVRILCDSSFWREHLIKKYPAEYQKLVDQHVDKLPEINCSMKDTDYQKLLAKITSDQDVAINHWIKAKTEQLFV